MSATGAPRLESMFLDEGFGSLDPETLDVVAAAIEELGSTGRMVGVVTHIRDLADRLPVRFEVTKLPGTSIVERVDR
jgi:exonuclease SbcC